MEIIDDIFIDDTNQKTIDIVYTYVDPSDENWVKKYNEINKTNKISPYRFDYDNEQVKFSLLTLQKYANLLVNNIYIVSDNQKFDLDFIQDNEFRNKIYWIDHTDIIDAEYLPTFNSLVIEAFLWNIPNLQNTFVYFNDDMFLGNYAFYKDFFDKDHKMKQFYNYKRSSYKHPWIININETNDLFQSIFPSHQCTTPIHAPYHINKTDMKICFYTFFRDLENMFQNHKIRSYNKSHNLVFLSAMYSLINNNAKNSSTSFSFINTLNDTIIKNLQKKHKKIFYCMHAQIPHNKRQKTYQQLKKVFLHK